MAPDAAIRDQLEKILTSAAFVNSERARALLRFLVGEVVEGGATAISEYLIAERVFGRGATFDPQVDSIVRVEMRRLRTRLADYYETAGREDAIEIRFPRKGYAPEVRARAAGRAERPSIGILPLEDITAAPGQEYFADGLTDALITELGKIEALRVISRTTMMHFRRSDLTVPAIARQLSLDYVVEGTVGRYAGQVRISGRLINARLDRQLWAESYELRLEDWLRVQGEVVRAIARELRIRLSPASEARLAPARTVAPAAYDAFLKGSYAWHQFSPEALQASLRYLEKAIETQPDYALAYAWKAYALQALYLNHLLSPLETLPAAEAAGRRAVELDAAVAEAQAAVAICEASRWNWDAADRGFREALRLNPGWALGIHQYAVLCLLPMRRLADALVQMQRAIEIDPLSLPNALQMSRIRIVRREYDLALAVSLEFRHLHPHSAELHRMLGDAYYQLGRYVEAAEAYARARELALNPRDWWRMALIERACGRSDSAPESVCGLEAACAGQYVAPSTRALTSLTLGDREAAIEEFVQALEARDPILPYCVQLPVCDEIRQDSRFEGIVTAMGPNR